MITYEQIKNNETIKTYIQSADETLKELGFTEHSFPHVTYVAEKAAYILETLGYQERTIGKQPGTIQNDTGTGRDQKRYAIIMK